MTDHPADAAAAHPPSPLFLQTAQQVAQAAGLEVCRVVQGSPITWQGVTFWLHHQGPLDPAAMLLVTEIGVLADDVKQPILDSLLRHHYLSAVTRTGYYAIEPQRGVLVHCMRIDFDRDPRPADTIISLVRFAAAQRDKLAVEMDSALAIQSHE